MPSINGVLAVRVLLGCILLSVASAAASVGDEPADHRDAVGDAVLAETEDAQQGPILIGTRPLIPDPPAEDRTPTPSGQPAADETSLDRQELDPAPQLDGTAEENAAEEIPDEQASDSTPSDAGDSPGQPEQRPELTPAMAALRDQVRRTLATFHRNGLSAKENTPTELMHACRAFGCSTEVFQSSPSGQKVNGISCLCWNYPCAGFEPLVLSEGRIAARIGYGLQQHDSQLLAVLALSRVQTTYPMRAGEEVRSVADLVEYEKLSCRSGTDLSLKLIGLAYYVADDGNWQNGLGEDWSIERIVREELARPIVGAANGGTDRLIGLSYAIRRRAKRGQPIDGQFARAQKLVDEFGDYALGLQNPDGSWSPYFFAAKGTGSDRAANLRSTGHILEWLAMALPEDRLEDPRVVKSVEYVNRALGSGSRTRRNVRSQSTREIGSVMHALHALAVYDERFFRPRTVPSETEGRQAARPVGDSR